MILPPAVSVLCSVPKEFVYEIGSELLKRFVSITLSTEILSMRWYFCFETNAPFYSQILTKFEIVRHFKKFISSLHKHNSLPHWPIRVWHPPPYSKKIHGWPRYERFFHFKHGSIPAASFYLLSSFSRYNFNNKNWKSLKGVLGIRTRGRRMVGADETTELRPRYFFFEN